MHRLPRQTPTGSMSFQREALGWPHAPLLELEGPLDVRVLDVMEVGTEKVAAVMVLCRRGQEQRQTSGTRMQDLLIAMGSHTPDS